MEKLGRANPAAGDDTASRQSALDQWRESIERAQKSRHTPAGVMQSEAEARADLEQRIRNGQAQCPTCAARTYQDDSHDGGVSFQAPTHIAASTAGVRVMSHESEHVTREGADAKEKGGQVAKSTVSLEWAKCPECGRTYVKGGLTTTTKHGHAAKSASRPRARLDVEG